MTTTVDADSTVSDATQITSADSPYLTQGEDTIQVDTSTASVTVTLASADLAAGREMRIIDSGLSAGTNSITIETEGTETINPGSLSSISISINGGYEDLFSDGANWFSSRNRDTATIDNLDGTGLQYDAVNTENELNGAYTLQTSDDIQSRLNSIAPANEYDRVSAILTPGDYNLTEINIPAGIVLFAAGANITPSGNYLFNISGHSSINGEGMTIQSQGYSGTVFLFNTTISANSPGSADPANILNYPTVEGGASGQTVVEVLQNDGSGVSNIYTEVNCQNASQLLHVDNSDIDGFVNNNTFIFSGSAAPESTVNVVSLENGANSANGNEIVAKPVIQVKSGDHLFAVSRGSYNIFKGVWADPSNVTNAAISWQTGAEDNIVQAHPQYPLSDSDAVINVDANTVFTENVALDVDSINIDNSFTAQNLTASTDPTNMNEFLSFSSSFATAYDTAVNREITADNTAQGLFDTNPYSSGLVIIQGSEATGIGTTFTDIMSLAGQTNFTVFQTEERGTPAARSYSFDPPLIDVAIDGAGESYQVTVRMMTGRYK